MRQILISAFILTLSVVISACGYHLRGQLPLSENVDVLYVNAKEGDFKSLLTDRLQSSGATVVDDLAAAKAILQVNGENISREPISIDANGKASSYKLIYKIDFLVADAEQEILKEGSVKESRQYDFDEGQATRQESDEAELAEEMQQELVIKLIRQLGAL